MPDLGLYNYVKKALALGKTKEEIGEALSRGGVTQADVNAMIDDVKHGRVPQVLPEQTAVSAISPAMKQKTGEYHPVVRPALITALAGYYFVSWFLAAVNWIAYMSRDSHYTALDPFAIFTLDALPGIAGFVGIFLGLIGYWRMKKWGVYLFTLAILGLFAYDIVKLVQAATPISGDLIVSFFLNFLLPFIVIIAGFINLSLME